MARQDRQGVRKPSDLERKYNFEKRFDDAMEAAADAKKAAEDVDKNLTPDEVFNRLTDDGKQQGIYKDENGDIYFNASYIKTGILLASLITAGILQSQDKKTFYLDLEKGILKGQFTEFSVSGKTVDDIAEEKANTAAQNAVSGQTQEYVFNKLTNDGKNEGIYILNGELYINASYLVAGILQSADKKTFYLDLEKNVLKGIFSEATINAATMTKATISDATITAATIAGKKVSWKQNDSGEYVLVGE